jgi:DNA-binding HxlR family transcriptional regulator
MGNYSKLHIKSRRLSALRFLMDEPGYEMNLSMLQSSLRNMAAFVMTRDMLTNEVLWLEEQGLVSVTPASDDMPLTIVKLTERGLYVARGELTAEGVDRPSPR